MVFFVVEICGILFKEDAVVYLLVQETDIENMPPIKSLAPEIAGMQVKTVSHKALCFIPQRFIEGAGGIQ